MATIFVAFQALLFLTMWCFLLYSVSWIFFPAVKPLLDYLWRPRKLYRPGPGADKKQMNRSDPRVHIWLITAWEVLSWLDKAVLASIVIGVLISITRWFVNIYTVFTNHQLLLVTSDFWMLFQGVLISPLHIFAAVVLIALAATTFLPFYWRSRWMWIYNFTILFDDGVWDEEAAGLWKAFFRLKPLKKKKKQSFTPARELLEYKSSTSPEELGYYSIFPMPVNEVSRGIQGMFKKWTFYKMLAFAHLYEWIVGERNETVGTESVSLLSRSGARAGDLLEDLIKGDQFGTNAVTTAGTRRDVEQNIDGIQGGAIKEGVGNFTEGKLFTLAVKQQLDREVDTRIAKLYPILYPEGIELFALASEYPDDLVVFFEPKRFGVPSSANEDEVLQRWRGEENA